MSLIRPAHALVGDFPHYALTMLKIKRREGGAVIPFVLKPVQVKLNNIIERNERRGRPSRVAVFKARRLGCSTGIAGKFFHRVVTRPYQRGLMVAHRGPDARTIFEIYERFYDHLPPWARPERSGGRGALLDLRRIGSQIEVISAESKQAGRGGDAQISHVSEAAFIENPEDFLAGLLRQVPATGDSIVVLESTADGPGTWWHDLYLRSLNGTSGWDWCFFAWFEDPEHRLPEALDPVAWTEYERDLHERYHVDGHQIAWLRYQLETEMFGDENRLRREFPATAEEGFIRVGDPAWPTAVITQCYERTPPLRFARVTERGIETTQIKEPEGQLVIWEEPQDGADFVMGCDVSGGLSTSTLCVCSVWRMSRKPGEWPVQVAEWAGRPDGVTFAQTINLIGHFYKKALATVEVTGIGRICQHALQKTYYYPRLYRWTRFDAYRATGDTWGWECVTPSSLILTADFGWILADQVRLGTTLVGCQEQVERGQLPAMKVQTVIARRTFTAPIIEVILADGQRTRVSATHPFLIVPSPWSWVQAQELRPGALLTRCQPSRLFDAGRPFLDRHGNIAPNLLTRSTIAVTSIRSLGEGPVIGLTTEPDHTLIVDGIVGHNTTWKSKEIMHGLADWCLRTKRVTIRSPWLMHELVNYQNVGGIGGDVEQYKGLSGDDRIFGAFLAWVSWFQYAYPGVPLKELRATLARLYGAPTSVESALTRAAGIGAPPTTESALGEEPPTERRRWIPRGRGEREDEGW